MHSVLDVPPSCNRLFKLSRLHLFKELADSNFIFTVFNLFLLIDNLLDFDDLIRELLSFLLLLLNLGLLEVSNFLVLLLLPDGKVLSKLSGVDLDNSLLHFHIHSDLSGISFCLPAQEVAGRLLAHHGRQHVASGRLVLELRVLDRLLDLLAQLDLGGVGVLEILQSLLKLAGLLALEKGVKTGLQEPGPVLLENLSSGQVGVEEELALVVVVLEGLESMQFTTELLAPALHGVQLEVVEDGRLVVLGGVLGREHPEPDLRVQVV